MRPDRVSNRGHLALESDALPTAPRGPAKKRYGTCHRQLQHLQKKASYALWYL